jgi:hypothetical protein
MKKIIFLVSGLLFSVSVSAQLSEEYPLLLSQYGLSGTANYISRAGAMGALGGDMTAASYNPAGLGVYRMSEITFSPGMNFGFTRADFNGLKSNDNKASFNFGNVGLLFNFNTNGSNVKNVQFAFGINRLRNFNNRTNITRDNLPNSYINHIFDAIWNDNDMYNDYCTSGVISVDYDPTDSTNYYDSDFLTGRFKQTKNTNEEGYLNEMTFSLSTNVQDVLFIGGTLGVPMFDYSKTTLFSEERFAPTSTGYYTSREIAELSGAGVNFKLGVIAKPVSWLRLGAAIHTPTYYSVDDYYFSEVSYNSTHGGDWPSLYYDIQTPFRFIGSLALVFGDNTSKVAGTISADYEYANYSTMKYYNYEGDIHAQNLINNNISNIYQASHSIRLGGELKFGVLALRAGYAMIGNPYVKEQNDASKTYITGGLGYKTKNFFFDLGYAYTLASNNAKYYTYDNEEALYGSATQPATKLSHNEHLIQATIGFRF